MAEQDNSDSADWTANDILWAIRSDEFGSDEEIEAFLTRRDAILLAAETAGIPRTVFLGFDPAGPGFEDRVQAAFGIVTDAAGIAVE